MPELPEVEAARVQLEKIVKGQIIRTARVIVDDRIIFDGASPAKVADALKGRKVHSVRRKGKYLWLELDKTPWPVFHFGMTGSLPQYQAGDTQPRHAKFEMIFGNGQHIAFCDPRRFGRVRLAQDPENQPPISRLGLDPLDAYLTVVQLKAIFAKTQRNLKAVLLDQKIFAGVGNWVADEILYQAKLSPKKLAAQLSLAEIGRLNRALKNVIETAVSCGADSDRFPKHWMFHRRWDLKPTVTAKGSKIVRETIAGRTTAWAPAEQK